jgi:hypothetical protein
MNQQKQQIDKSKRKRQSWNYLPPPWNKQSMHVRKQWRETESVTFRIDTASKKILQANAIADGFTNMSEYLRHLCAESSRQQKESAIRGSSAP